MPFLPKLDQCTKIGRELCIRYGYVYEAGDCAIVVMQHKELSNDAFKIISVAFLSKSLYSVLFWFIVHFGTSDTLQNRSAVLIDVEMCHNW